MPRLRLLCSVAVAVLLLTGRFAFALDPVATVVTNVDPYGLSVNPTTGRLFEVGTDMTNGQRVIRVIDGVTYQQSTVVLSFNLPPSPPMPYGAAKIALNVATNRLYIPAFSGGQSILAVYDQVADTVSTAAVLP